MFDVSPSGAEKFLEERMTSEEERGRGSPLARVWLSWRAAAGNHANPSREQGHTWRWQPFRAVPLLKLDGPCGENPIMNRLEMADS